MHPHQMRRRGGKPHTHTHTQTLRYVHQYMTLSVAVFEKRNTHHSDVAAVFKCNCYCSVATAVCCLQPVAVCESSPLHDTSAREATIHTQTWDTGNQQARDKRQHAAISGQHTAASMECSKQLSHIAVGNKRSATRHTLKNNAGVTHGRPNRMHYTHHTPHTTPRERPCPRPRSHHHHHEPAGSS